MASGEAVCNMAMMVHEIRNECAAVDAQLLSGPITPDVTAEEIRQSLRARFDFSKPLNLESVVAEAEEMLQKWQVQVTHPRYFGLFNPSVTVASVVADTLVAMYNPQLAAWRTSPGANEIERHTLAWLAGKFGLPETTQATFTSGGAEANHSAVIVALTHAFPEYGERGLQGIDTLPTIYLTSESHHSFSKIAHMTGLGRRALRMVATDAEARMDMAALELQVADDLRNGFSPLMVVGTAGTTSGGAIDPLPELGRFCRDAGLWLHVDAAWGGAAILSPALRPYLAGIDLADSITCDAHKWFSVSMGCGMFFCRHPESVKQAFRAETTYMPRPAGSTCDPYTTTIQWSRRFIGLKLFLSLAERGESGYAAMIDHQTAMGTMLRDSLAASGWRIVNRTPLPLVCVKRDGLDVIGFLIALREKQIAWMSETRIADVPVIRACVTSYKTQASDVERVVGEMNRLVPAHTAQSCVSARV